MTIKRKNNHETDFDKESRLAKTTAANFSPRSEKTSWIRKRNNMQKFIEESINPIEEQIQDHHINMMSLYQELTKLKSDEDRKQFAKKHILPIEQTIQEMQQELITLYDKVDIQRKAMISTCVHPYDELRYNINDKTVRCTFCNKKMLPRG